MSAPSPQESGSSPVTAVFGVAIFLFFLLLASQALLHLYATSIVTSVAFTTATRVAAEDLDCGPGGGIAEELARERLGGYGQRPGLVVRCEQTVDDTVVTIQVPSPARGLATARSGLTLDAIERTASVRTEEFRG